jgi:hypothetical protein
VIEIGGAVVPGATVGARSSDESPSYNHLFGETQTDGNGGFQLTVDSGTHSPIGCVYLVVAKERYVGITVHPTGSTEDLTIMLQRFREATGTVVEIDGGPVAGVSVTTGGSKGVMTTTDARGRFVLRDVGNHLWFSKDGYVNRELVVPQGQDVALGTVNLQRAIRLSVRSRVATARPGERSLRMLLPVSARVLLVGMRSTTLDPQPVLQPVPFELSAAVPDPGTLNQ